VSTRILHTIPNLLTTAAASTLRGVLPTTAGQSPVVTRPTLADLGLPKLTFTVTARRVRGVPLKTAAGRYLLTVIGDPPSMSAPGGVTMIQLPVGMTLDDAMLDAEEAHDAPPAFFDRSVMPGGPEIGADGVGVAVIDLVPGEWVVAGYAMTTEPTTMTVSGSFPATPPEPAADATVVVGAETLALRAGRMRAGQNLIRVDNTDARPRFVTIARVPRGTTAATPVDPARALHVASTSDQSGGSTMWLSLDLAPGTYALSGDGPDAGHPAIFTVAYA
jgi:hypothetical protein